jgi:outer membrane protein assembly factor BamA
VPLLGVQYFDFDLFGKGKQLSTFFGGVILTTNYTDPAFLGSHFDVGVDLFGFAIPFTDLSYRNGKEVKEERLKHIPAVSQINIGHPLGPYMKASLGLFAKWDDYQRDPDTAPEFVTPQDTFTFGYEGKLTANVSGFNATLDYAWFHRQNWEFWGIPGESEFQASQRDYEKYYAEIAKDYYFTGFRKIHAAITYLSGSDLDRFSRYEFGSFSGNPIRGYQSGALRTSKAWVMNLSYGLNIENIIRLEVLYDQGLMDDPVSGFHNAYYSGGGISGQLNGPWNNSFIRFDVGVPIVSHGIHGVTASALVLKLF